MRLLLILALLAGCGSDPTVTADAASAAPDGDAPQRTYAPADADAFCETVVTDAFIRAHFGVPAGVPIEHDRTSYNCSGHWGAASSALPAASTYDVWVNLGRDVAHAETLFRNATQERTDAENDAAIDDALDGDPEAPATDTGVAEVVEEAIALELGATTVEPLDGLGDEAAVVRTGGASPMVTVRVGTVVLSGITAEPPRPSADVDPDPAAIEARSLAFARALVARL